MVLITNILWAVLYITKYGFLSFRSIEVLGPILEALTAGQKKYNQ